MIQTIWVKNFNEKHRTSCTLTQKRKFTDITEINFKGICCKHYFKTNQKSTILYSTTKWCTLYYENNVSLGVSKSVITANTEAMQKGWLTFVLKCHYLQDN